MHKISSNWFTLIGVIVMWIPAVVIAYFTGGRDLTNFNFRLVTPIARRMIPKKYLHTKLKVINIVKNSDKN